MHRPDWRCTDPVVIVLQRRSNAVRPSESNRPNPHHAATPQDDSVRQVIAEIDVLSKEIETVLS
jgi:hypothetical protein